MCFAGLYGDTVHVDWQCLEPWLVREQRFVSEHGVLQCIMWCIQLPHSFSCIFRRETDEMYIRLPCCSLPLNKIE